MKVSFQCPRCMKHPQDIEVVERESNESIKEFMFRIMVSGHRTHRKISPFCKNNTYDIAFPKTPETEETLLLSGKIYKGEK